jgi:hypothetical protein
MKGFKISVVVATAVAVVALAAPGRAASLGSDNASDAVYSGLGNYNGLNGGTGFGAWTNTPSVNSGFAGSFIGSSTNNAGGSSGGIDSTGGKAWGMYGNSGNAGDSVRPFTGGALSIGQTVKVDLDQGYEDTGATVGFGLQNAASSNLVEVYYIGGDTVNSWKKNDAGGQVNLAADGVIGFTGDGLHLEITLLTATTYSGTLNKLNPTGAPVAFSGTLNAGAGDQAIVKLRLFNFNSGGGNNANFYGNNLAVVPEPSTIMLVGFGLLGALALRRRK